MKNTSSFFALLLVIAGTASATAPKCTDLSHIYKMGDSDVYVRQECCDSWTRQRYFDGQPEGEPSVLTLSPKWVIAETDDLHEKETQHHRWFWNTDGTQVIHDYTFDSFLKKSEVASYGTLTETFSLEGDRILRSGNMLVREALPTGKVTIKSTPRAELYQRLRSRN